MQPEIKEIKYDEVEDILATLFPARGKGNLLSADNGLITIESLWKRLEHPKREPVVVPEPNQDAPKVVLKQEA